jgi:hypothetical protein
MAMARLRRVAMTWGPFSGAELGGVFGVADVADVVQGLDLLVTRGSRRRAGRGGLEGALLLAAVTAAGALIICLALTLLGIVAFLA